MDETKHTIGGRPLAALLLGGLCISGSPIFVRLSELGPITTAFWRLSLAVIPLIVLFRNSASNVVKMPRGIREHVLAGLPGIFLAADLAAWHVSLHMTSVANSTLLANMMPVFVALGSWLVLGERIRGPVLAGLVLSIVGIVILRGGPAAFVGGQIKGDALALTAAAFYAVYFLLLGRARQIFPTAVTMLWSTVTAAICTLPVAILLESTLLPSTIYGWAVLIGVAWMSQAAGQSLITYSLAWLPATFSSLTLLIQPVVSAMLAWVILSEPLNEWQMVGGAIVITGIVLAKR